MANNFEKAHRIPGDNDDRSEAGKPEIPGAELLDKTLGGETEAAFVLVEEVALQAEALAEHDPELRERALSLRDRAKKLQKQMLGIARIIGIGAAIALAADAADYESTRYTVSEHADGHGEAVFEHEDQETTRIIDYFSGKGALPEADRRAMEIKDIKRMGDINKVDLPENLNDFSEDQLSELWDNIEGSLYDKYKLLRRYYTKGQLKKIVPAQYAYNAEFYKALWAIERETGNPKIRFEDFSEENKFEVLLKMNPGRAHYDGGTNTMYINYPAYTFQFANEEGLPNPDSNIAEDFISETAHGKQWNNKPLRYDLLTIRDIALVVYRAMMDKKALNETYEKTLYDKPGTIEYEAHRQIQPELEKKLDEYKKERAVEREKEGEESRKRALESGHPWPH